RAAQSGIQAEPADIAVEQLEPAVRRPLLRHELDRQISLDHLPQAAYAQTHQRGLRERKSDVGTSALLIRGEAPLMHFSCCSIPNLFSDWGCAPSRAFLLRVRVPPHPRRGDAWTRGRAELGGRGQRCTRR